MQSDPKTSGMTTEMETIDAGVVDVSLTQDRAKMIRSILSESVRRATLIECDRPDRSREVEVIPDEISGDMDRLLFEFRFSDCHYQDIEASTNKHTHHTILAGQECVGDMTFVVEGDDVTQCQMNVRSRNQDFEAIHSAVIDLYRTVYSIITGHLDKEV